MDNELLNENENIYSKLACEVLTRISKIYWNKMYQYIKDNNIDEKEVNSLIINPERMVLYFSQKHLAIEYFGNPMKKEIKEVSKRKISIFDYTKEVLDSRQFINKIIGFNYDGTSGFALPLFLELYEDLIIPTNAGAEKLADLNWNYLAQNNCTAFNVQGLELMENQFVRLVNCSFFDCKNGDLKSRIIKWIDFIPLVYDDTLNGEYDQLTINLDHYVDTWQIDMYYQYPEPDDFKYEKLPRVNRFIELFGNSINSETDITSFLEEKENAFIISMAFTGVNVYGQVECEWQSEDKANIRPDFFVKKSDGYADIIEFKLPAIKNKVVVGRENREQFSAEINSYIAQTRVYKQYFEDPNNRKWFEEKYKYKVRYPKRYLVIGRRYDFNSDLWKEIKEEFKDLEIITYDDLVDTVVTQFYM